MSDLCPYCGARPTNSDDHIFSEFLGGQTTIRACKYCNDTFGHSVEGPAFLQLVQLAVSLRNAGLHPPKYLRWKRAIKDPATGIEYDLDSNWTLHPSKP